MQSQRNTKETVILASIIRNKLIVFLINVTMN